MGEGIFTICLEETFAKKLSNNKTLQETTSQKIQALEEKTEMQTQTINQMLVTCQHNTMINGQKIRSCEEEKSTNECSEHKKTSAAPAKYWHPPPPRSFVVAVFLHFRAEIRGLFRLSDAVGQFIEDNIHSPLRQQAAETAARERAAV